LDQEGIDANFFNKAGHSPIDFAYRDRSGKITKLMSRQLGRTPKDSPAARLKNLTSWAKQVWQGPLPDMPPSSEQFPPLLKAAYKGDLDAFTAQLAQGADPNQKDKVGRTALHFAAAKGSLAVVKTLCAYQETVVDLNQQDRYGHTALAMAAYFKHPDVVRCLLREGNRVRLDLANDYGELLSSTRQQ
jgi:ankyrin repeat protein